MSLMGCECPFSGGITAGKKNATVEASNAPNDSLGNIPANYAVHVVPVIAGVICESL